jgi:hypothetical protein
MLLRVAFIAAMAIVVMAPLTLAAYVLVPGLQIRQQIPAPRSEVPITDVDQSKRQHESASDMLPQSTTGGALSASRPERQDEALTPPATHRLEPSYQPSVSDAIPPTQSQSADNKRSETAQPVLPPQSLVPEVVSPNREGVASSSSPAAKEKTATARAEKQNTVDLFLGPHIIVVCSELNKDQRQRAGCQ